MHLRSQVSILIFPSLAVKYRGRDDTIAGRATDREADQARAVEGEWFQPIHTGNDWLSRVGFVHFVALDATRYD